MTNERFNYVLGLDVGIGSVGWAVVRDDEKKRIEDFGVRIFDSGEEKNGQNRDSQIRRGFRSSRRLTRRRVNRRKRLKNHLQKIGLIQQENFQAYLEDGSHDVLALRVKGLDQKLSANELALALLHICNHRGFQNFYDISSDDSAEEKKAEEQDRVGAAAVDGLMKQNHYRSPAEMIFKDEHFNGGSNQYRSYRNRRGKEETYLISRDWYRREVDSLLAEQKKYYACLTEENCNYIKYILFKQRCFEEGPGDPNDSTRKYTGAIVRQLVDRGSVNERYIEYLNSMGKCRFYKDEDRGSRFTVIADLYAAVNTLSQYLFYDETTGEAGINHETAEGLLKYAVENGGLTKPQFEKYCKKHKYGVTIPKGLDGNDIKKAFKFIKPVKKILESSGYCWKDFAGSDYMDPKAKINQIGILLSKYITPSRRKQMLKSLGFLNDKAVELFSRQKFSGTANVSYKYMKGAIEAFCEGVIYGDYQADVINAQSKQETAADCSEKLPPFKKDCEFFKNPVVFRSVNETRKVINAIVGRYGSPCAVNIETANELNKCYLDRKKDISWNKKNEKKREQAKTSIAELLGITPEEVTGMMVEKYLLGQQQDWKSLYSGKEINQKQCLAKDDRNYEVDHIIPFSLILDNTLTNKALVLADENQAKGQRTPLMYLAGEQRKAFVGTVNTLLTEHKINKKKYKYLMQEDLNDAELLGEWKSRNLNDTRYISKYLVNYLSNHLKLSERSSKGTYRGSKVYGIKSAVTSKMRRQWLNGKTWGVFDKSKLKVVTYLDHAADAVVIANCLPGYVEIAMENMKLRNIYYRAKKQITAEYTDSLNNAVERINRYYGIDADEIRRTLSTHFKRTPSLIEKLREEVDIRFMDPGICAYFAEQNGDEIPTAEEVEKTFRTKVKEFYQDDPEFAERVRMPQTSYKVEKKFSGEATDANPVSVRDNGENWYKRTNVMDLKFQDIDKIFTDDKNLAADLKEVFAKAGVTAPNKDQTLGKILQKEGKTEFITKNGRRVRGVTLREKAEKTVHKVTSEKNYTDLPNAHYYCLEFYNKKDGMLGMRGINYTDLVKKGGRLQFSEKHRYPEDYASHLMYVHKNEYLEVLDRNGRRKEKSGFFVSIANIKQKNIRTIQYNTPNNPQKPLSLTEKDRIKKYYFDILGYRGGEIKECGEL